MLPFSSSLRVCIRRAGPAAIPVALALAIPGFALGQATRTWVSGVGDDANPCSRTAPCKTFAGAISKTAAGGEIDTLEAGGFGAVTITKAVTIKSVGVIGGILVSGGNGITINDSNANDKITLSGLDFNGLGNSSSGVSILTPNTVRIDNSQIYGFNNAGVVATPSTGVARVQIVNSDIFNNAGDGVVMAPSGSAKARATLIGDTVENDNCGVVATTNAISLGANAANCGAATGTGSSAVAKVFSFQTSIIDNNNAGSPGIAALSEGTNASNLIGQDTIITNFVGLQSADGGTITSFGDNSVFGNSTNGAPTPPNATKSSGRAHAKARAKHHSRKRAKHR